MPRINFSTEEMKIFDLTNDLARGDFSIHVDSEKVTDTSTTTTAIGMSILGVVLISLLFLL